MAKKGDESSKSDNVSSSSSGSTRNPTATKSDNVSTNASKPSSYSSPSEKGGQSTKNDNVSSNAAWSMIDSGSTKSSSVGKSDPAPYWSSGSGDSKGGRDTRAPVPDVQSDDLRNHRTNNAFNPNAPYPDTQSDDLRNHRTNNAFDPNAPYPANRSAPTSRPDPRGEALYGDAFWKNNAKLYEAADRPDIRQSDINFDAMFPGGNALPTGSDPVLAWLDEMGVDHKAVADTYREGLGFKPPTENAQRYGIDWAGIFGAKEPTAAAQADGFDLGGIEDALRQMFGGKPPTEAAQQSGFDLGGLMAALSGGQSAPEAVEKLRDTAMVSATPDDMDTLTELSGDIYAPGKGGQVLPTGQQIAPAGIDTALDERLAATLPSNEAAALLGDQSGAFETMVADGSPIPVPTYTGKRGQIPSDIVYAMLGEAYGEGNEGLEAVAEVMGNRANSGRYPDNVLDVVNQPMAFSALNEGEGGNNPQGRFKALGPEYNEAEQAFMDAAGNDVDPTQGATHYWATKDGEPYWLEDEMERAGVTRDDLIRIGGHTFIPNTNGQGGVDAGPKIAPDEGEEAAPQNASFLDKSVDVAGKIAENTALGTIVKTFFPDFWEGSGNFFKGLDGGNASTETRGGGSRDENTAGGRGKAPVSADLWDWIMSGESSDSRDGGSNGGAYTGGGSAVYVSPITGVPGDFNGNGIPDYLEVPGTGPVGTTPGNGGAKFPKIPPYRPGVDDEWNYFPGQTFAAGGMVADPKADPEINPAMGPVAATGGMDPRLIVIHDAEMALRGEHPQPKAALRKFVSLFGEAALESLKKSTAIKMGKPRLIEGRGGGKDDLVPAVVDGVGEAKLSNGEFVVTADAVRAAGDGDTDRGAQKLMELNDMLEGHKPSKVLNVEKVTG